MGYSREVIRHVLEWDGSSSRDGNGSDYCYDVLERADPTVVATVKKQLADEAELIRPLGQSSVAAHLKHTGGLTEAQERRHQRLLPFNFVQD